MKDAPGTWSLDAVHWLNRGGQKGVDQRVKLCKAMHHGCGTFWVLPQFSFSGTN